MTSQASIKVVMKQSLQSVTVERHRNTARGTTTAQSTAASRGVSRRQNSPAIRGGPGDRCSEPGALGLRADPAVADQSLRWARGSVMRRDCRWLIAVIATLYSLSANAQEGLTYSGKAVWDSANGSLTFITSGSMPDTKEGFYWQVPPEVRVIKIGPAVTVTGGFRVPRRKSDNPLRICGADRDTSVLYGTDTEKWTARHEIPENDKWKYGAICVLGNAVVSVSDLTSRNPRGYNVSGYSAGSVIHVERCNLVDTRNGANNNSDGFIGAAGSSITDSFISTSDDGIKVYSDITIKNVTIEQHRNGSPIQFGWGGESGRSRAEISNLTIVGADRDGMYNMAPFTWEGGKDGIRDVFVEHLKVKIDGKLYFEGKWQPIGLFALKPRGCTLNLTIVDGEIAVPGRSVIRTQGKVTVNGQAYP
jgi:hypothetical protein